jgi:hypothetical protein
VWEFVVVNDDVLICCCTWQDLRVEGDSQLVVKQMLREYRVKNERMVALCREALQLAGNFPKFSIRCCPCRQGTPFPLAAPDDVPCFPWAAGSSGSGIPGRTGWRTEPWKSRPPSPRSFCPVTLQTSRMYRNPEGGPVSTRFVRASCTSEVHAFAECLLLHRHARIRMAWFGPDSQTLPGPLAWVLAC